MGEYPWFCATTLLVFLCCFLGGFAESSSMELQSDTSAKRMRGTELIIPLSVKTTFVYYASEQSHGDAKSTCEGIGGRLASLVSNARAQAFYNNRDKLGDKFVWVGATRSENSQFQWETEEYMEPTNIPISSITDYGYDCMLHKDYKKSPITSSYFYNNQPCSQPYHFVCEIDKERPNDLVSNRHDFLLRSQFMIVQLDNLNYTAAEAYCSGDIDGSKGGRLFGPTTFREMRTLDEGLARAGLEGRWWLGAQRLDFADDPLYKNGDRIPTELRKWELDHGGKCMIYDSSTSKFGWENCNIDRRMHDVAGVICQDDEEGKRK